MQKLEIEQKFLLKSLPTSRQPDEIVDIDQYYLKLHGRWERARTWFSSTGQETYIHTIKKAISKRVNVEDEKFLTKDEFDAFTVLAHQAGTEARFISKRRHIFKDGDLKWEVDQFDNGYHLIVAEIEIPDANFEITIPDFIQEVLLLEVTGLKQFSNRNLSLPI